MTIQLTKTRDLPPSASEPQGGITNIYNPSTGKDERANMGQFQNVQNWIAKTYQYSPTIVIVDDKQYLLTENVPYTSTNFQNELDSGIWKPFISGGEFDLIKLNPNSSVELTEEGQIKWCDRFYSPKYETGLGATISIGNIEYIVFYNDTGATIPSGKNLHLKSGFVFNGFLYPTFEYADPRNWEKVQGTLGMSIHSVPNNSLGLIARSAQLIETDTSSVSGGSQLWIKPDGSGDFTDVIPQFPNIPISIGGSYDSAVEGSVFFNITTDINELINNSWDGSIIESFNFTVSSDGSIVTGLLENKDNTRNLVAKFSTGLHTIDTTSAQLTIALNFGTDVNPQINYVYIPESTKVITVSTSGWPTTEHCKVAEILLQSASTTQSNGGALRNQNINDHLKETGDNGHILHISERIRQFNAEHDNGTEGSLDNTGGNGYVIVTGGQVWQLHKQDFPAFNMATGDIIKIANDFTTPYRETSNLASITEYSDGSAWNNDWSKIVVWGVANKTGEASFLMANIPSDGYNSEANAFADALNYADYSIPETFKGVGFLIAAFTVRISGGVITYNPSTGYQDLRGFIPNNIAGGGGGGGGITSFLGLTDTFSSYAGRGGEVVIVNDGESGTDSEPKSWLWNTLRTFYHNIVSTATVNRTATLQDRDGTIAYLDDINNSSVEKDPFTETIEIANLLQHSPNYTPSSGSTLNIIKGAASAFIGGEYQCVFTCDNNTFVFNSDFEDGTSDIVGVSGRVWLRFTLNPDGKLGVNQYGTSGAPSLIKPTVTTQAVTGIGSDAATGNGNITDLGSDNPTAHGFVWSLSPNPTLSDSFVDNGAAAATGTFTGSIAGLDPSQTYYVKAFATNSAGTSYGDEVTFDTTAASGLLSPTINLVSSGIYDAEITYTSNNTSPLEDNNYLEVSDQSDFSVVKEIRFLPIGSGIVSVGALLPSTQYYYRMKAVSDSVADSSYSAVSNSTTLVEMALSAQVQGVVSNIQDMWVADENIVSGDGVNVDSVTSSGSLATTLLPTTTKPTINNDADGTGKKTIVINTSDQKLDAGATYPISGSKKYFYAVVMYKSTTAPHAWWNGNFWRIKKQNGGDYYTGDYFNGALSRNVDSRLNKLDIIMIGDDNTQNGAVNGSMGDFQRYGSYVDYLANVQSYVGNDGNIEVGAILVGSSVLTNMTQITSLYNKFTNYYKLAGRQNHKYIMYVGDSIFQGIGAANNGADSAAITITNDLRSTYTSEQFQYSGVYQSGYSLENNLNTLDNKELIKNYMISHDFALGNKVACVFAGTNDLVGGLTALEVFDLLKDLSYYLNCYFDHVIVLTSLYRVGGNDTKTDDFNNYIKNENWQKGVSYVDVASDSRLMDYTDLTYFNADQIHPNSTGHTVINELLKPVVVSKLGL